MEKKSNNKQKSTPVTMPEYALGVKVRGSSMSDLEFAMRRFKTLVKDSGVLEEYRSRQEYIKPSVIKRKQKMEAIRRKNNEYYYDDEC